MSKHLVLVESPTKAKTLGRYLGSDYTVLATYGHIRDLPSKNGSVDPDQNFRMVWDLDERSEKVVKDIVAAVKFSDSVYLATDPDREGEAISWHVHQILLEKGVLRNIAPQRIVFHEITKTAVQQAFRSPRDIDTALVHAYLARRALDYLVGFTLSPILWRKLPGARSAGRVQSVALRIIVEREQEIQKFETQEYWSIQGLFTTDKKDSLEARLTYWEGEKLEKFSFTNGDQAGVVVDRLLPLAYAVQKIEKKQAKRSPAAPFMTSTLQQEASRKLGFSASRTMQVAQKLYEGIEIRGEMTGLITYMRTDSTSLSKEALTQIRDYLKGNYGEKYLPSSARVFKNKVKNAQEAHEAIRPTQVSLRPQDIESIIDRDQYRLYDLIWKRTVASQMTDALFDQVGVDIADTSQKHIFRATGSTLVFDGFLKLYQEGRDDQESDDGDRRLPPLKEGDVLLPEAITPLQHFTQPPPRYTEATLVKRLEELGIGRPSTYASLIQVLQDRDYVRLEKRTFIAEDKGHLVTSFLVAFFQKYVQYDFTAQMEESLDRISSEEEVWTDILHGFWKDFIDVVGKASELRITDVINAVQKDLIPLFFKTDEAVPCPQCQTGNLSLKLGKFGAFWGCTNYPECKHTRPFASEAPKDDVPDEEIGEDPETKEKIFLRKGPYGLYLEWSKREEDGKTPKRIRLAQKNGTVSLNHALFLKNLPLPLGTHPETEGVVTLNIGPYGPYVKHQDQLVSIGRKVEDFTKITLNEALDLIKNAKPKKPRPKKAVVKKTTKTIKATPKKTAKVKTVKKKE